VLEGIVLTFDLRSSIVTIGPLDPALLLSLAAVSLIALPLGRALGRLTRRVKDHWRRRLYVWPAWPLLGLVLFILPQATVVVVYPLIHPDDGSALVCFVLVWPAFILPAVVGYAAALRRRVRDQPQPPATQAVQS